jgi:hypothetical protein
MPYRMPCLQISAYSQLLVNFMQLRVLLLIICGGLDGSLCISLESLLHFSMIYASYHLALPVAALADITRHSSLFMY